MPGDVARPERLPTPELQSAPRSGMGLADFEGLALGNNPTLRQAAANVQAARGRWLQVGLYPNPIGGYVGTEIGNEGRAGQQGSFISQELVTGGKLRLNREIASQEIRRLEAEAAAQRGRVLNDVRIYFFEALVAQRGVELAGELVRIGEQGADTANRLLQAKEVSYVDVLQASVELETARLQGVNARNRQLSTWRRLAVVVGVPQMQPVILAGQVDRLSPPIAWEDAVAKLIAQSPELAAAQIRINRARSAAQRAGVQSVPNVNVQAMVQHDNATTDDIVSVQIGMPIPVLNRNQGGIQQTQAELIASCANAERVALMLQSRLAVVFEAYTNARNQAEAYSTRVLPSARRSLDIVNGGYRQGEFNFLTLLTAQRTYFQANVAYLSAISELRRSEAMIEGLMLSDSLATPALETTADAATSQ